MRDSDYKMIKKYTVKWTSYGEKYSEVFYKKKDAVKFIKENIKDFTILSEYKIKKTYTYQYDPSA